MNLLEIADQIKNFQSLVLELDQKILNEMNNKNALNVEIEAIKLQVSRDVYFSDSYKNDKQRELALKENCRDLSTFQHFTAEILEVNEKIQNLEYNKSLAMIELSYFKNVLKVFEIEATKLKAGV